MINSIKDRHRYASMFFMSKNTRYINRKSKYSKYKNYEQIILPETISLESEHREKLIKIITHIHKKLDSNVNKFFIDFSKTKKIIADGMIVFYSETKNIINTYPDVIFKTALTSNSKINQVLKQINIFNICNTKSDSVNIKRHDVIHWRLTSGIVAITSKYPDIIDEGDFKYASTKSYLYSACTEATINTKKHAYDEHFMGSRRVDGEKEIWWCFSQILDKKVSVFIYDLGLTLPETLPKKRPLLYKILKEMSLTDDAEMILGGIETPSSSTGEDFRGNGLPRIASIAKETSSSTMMIHSRKGSVIIGNNRTKKINHKIPLQGTLVSWIIDTGEHYGN